MLRVPCKICGLEILPTTAERNHGLCGPCASGARPCVYCGRHVAKPLSDGVYAHIECSIRNEMEQESLGWKTLEDIDWEMIHQLLRGMLRRLFDRVGGGYSGTGPMNLLFYVDVEDFIEIAVYEVLPNGRAKIQPDGSPTRLSDAQWEKSLSPLSSSYSLLREKFSDEEAIEAAESVTRRLTDILSDECRELAKDNFSFPKSVPVSWIFRTDA